MEFGVGERGAGAFLETIKAAYPSDETRQRKVVGEYKSIKLRALTLDAARPYLKPPSQALVPPQPASNPHLTIEADEVVGHFGETVQSITAYVRLLVNGREFVQRIDDVDPRAVAIMNAQQLGRPRQYDVPFEYVLARRGSTSFWTYGSGQSLLHVVAPHVDFAALQQVLHQPVVTMYERVPNISRVRRWWYQWRRHVPLVVVDAQVQAPLERLDQVAATLEKGLTAAPDKVSIVTTFLQHRTLRAGSVVPRGLAEIAGANTVTRTEVAVLAAALLQRMGVEIRLVRARCDDESTFLCVWNYQEHWYGAPVFAPMRIQVHGETIQEWQEPQESTLPEALPGWQVLSYYQHLSPRSLSLTLSPATTGDDTLENGLPTIAIIPNCPKCNGRMQQKAGRYGAFLGCVSYPQCKGTLSLPIRDDLNVSR